MLVGVGQVTDWPDGRDPAERPGPYALMAEAVRAAAADASGSQEGAQSGTPRALLDAIESLRVVGMLGWRAPNLALGLADELGCAPAELMVSAIGGNMPQAMLFDAAAAIIRGEVDVAVVAGAECIYTRRAARRAPDHPALNWGTQDADTPPPVAFGTDRMPVTELELARGIVVAIDAYPLMENALRGARGWSLEEHRARIGTLWSSFSEVAADNPYAWSRTARSAEEIMTVTEGNRMVSFPYPKLAMANLTVDQSAAFICCSVAAARRLGLPDDGWVFPHSGAEAVDHWFLSHRENLYSSPAIAAAGRQALTLAGVGIAEIGPIDLYSCFPIAVSMGAEALGLPIDDPARPLTLTGGLTFGGGPGNNYVSHSIAAMVAALREAPDAPGLVTGLGWYATKHAVGVYGAKPPEAGFRVQNAQAEVDALPQCRSDATATGPVAVETYTVTFDRGGRPERAILALRTKDDARTWGNVLDAATLAELTTSEGCGRTGTLGADGIVALA